MDQSLERRIEHLESLFAEQEYTLQALNDTVSRQDREITSLTLAIERLKQQIDSLKSDVSSDISPEHEKPPHY